MMSLTLTVTVSIEFKPKGLTTQGPEQATIIIPHPSN